MKNQLELYKAARDLAESLQGETSARKISEATNSKFSTLELDDDDYATFQNNVMAIKGQYEGLAQRPTATEAKRLKAEAAKPKTA
jgi:hypothetical protein